MSEMIQVYYILYTGPLLTDVSEPQGPILLPGVPAPRDHIRIDWEHNPEGSRWFVVEYVRWWPGEYRADVVGQWEDLL